MVFGALISDCPCQEVASASILLLHKGRQGADSKTVTSPPALQGQMLLYCFPEGGRLLRATVYVTTTPEVAPGLWLVTHRGKCGKSRHELNLSSLHNFCFFSILERVALVQSIFRIVCSVNTLTVICHAHRQPCVEHALARLAATSGVSAQSS